jgi:cephalosporin hydroxylase
MDRVQLINYLIERNGYRSYLEIGCEMNWCFEQVRAVAKTGVDPVSGGNWRGTSDAFFEQNTRKFDVIFIDGDHSTDQVWRDLRNGLKSVSPGGVIVLHDCLPTSEWEAEDGWHAGSWMGGVWKVAAAATLNDALEVVIGDFDCGCAVVRLKPTTPPDLAEVYPGNYTWSDFERSRWSLLNIRSWEELKRHIDFGLVPPERMMARPDRGGAPNQPAPGYATAQSDPVTEFHRQYYEKAEQTWCNTWWRGVQIWKCPLDLWIYQEIIAETRPDLIIETGTALGGSSLYLADICSMLGNGRVITVDTEWPERMHRDPRITYIRRSSVDPATVSAIKNAIGPHDRVMVILDSEHNFSHVLAELRAYGPLVTPGSYLIAEDGNVNGHPVLRGFGPGPAEAVKTFLAEDSTFVEDSSREKFLLTFNPGGYLRRLKMPPYSSWLAAAPKSDALPGTGSDSDPKPPEVSSPPPIALTVNPGSLQSGGPPTAGFGVGDTCRSALTTAEHPPASSPSTGLDRLVTIRSSAQHLKQAVAIVTYDLRRRMPILKYALGGVSDQHKYPVFVVCNGYADDDFGEWANRLHFIGLPENGHLIGAIKALYEYTDLDEYLILHDTCFVKDVALFDLVFYRWANRSVALSPNYLMHIAKYRRTTLSQVSIPSVVNLWESYQRAEMDFHRNYIRAEPDYITLFPEWTDQDVYEQRWRRRNM